MKIKKIIIFLFAAAAVLYFSCIHLSGNPESGKIFHTPASGRTSPADDEPLIDIKTGYSVEKETAAEGEREIKALFKAYSSEISRIGIRNNEWAFLLDGEWFYWQGGRLLPESKLDDGSSYRSYGFYNYPLKLPGEVVLPDERQLERIRNFTRSRQAVSRDTTFLDTLYGGATYNEIIKNIKTTGFLGYRFQAHEKIIPVLAKIEEEIREAEKSDPSLTEFIGNLSGISCFNWREIEGSMSRSYHSYGIAVDLIPDDKRRKEVYWVWTSYHNEEWYAVPYSSRWMVPQTIVEIFEKYGFIWGGKWLFYDNMHFEYRPELLILAGQEVVFVNQD